MLEIADWLKELGMSEYVQRFAENGITAEALHHLTDQDLKDIGVLLGHRRIMLAAIGRLADAPPIALPESAKESKAAVAAELRQVTVVFGAEGPSARRSSGQLWAAESARVGNLERINVSPSSGPQVAFLKAEPRVARPGTPRPELLNA